MIKYIGSKRLIIPFIEDICSLFSGVKSFFDVFSGTSRVGHAMKKKGLRVIANDNASYAATIARCYIVADADRADEVKRLLKELMRVPPKAGYFTKTFCEDSRFFQPHNGVRIDAMREYIAKKHLDPELEDILLTALMEAADRVDSTTGVHMAYLKQWAPRALNNLELRMPELVVRSKYGKGEALQLDALQAIGQVEADIAYFDPPYNQHKYSSNYHIWESLVRWDKPEVYGVARKRIDCREEKSPFNSRHLAYEAFKKVLLGARAKYLIVSFNNEGFLAKEDLISILKERGYVSVLEHNYRRYVGAQIGIFNPQGVKVGKVSHLRNKEYIFVVTPSLALSERIASSFLSPQKSFAFSS